MSGSTILDEVEIIDGGKSGGVPPRAGGDDDSGNGSGRSPFSSRRYFTGISLGLVAIVMFFMALTSAYIVRKGFGGDWRPVRLPSFLWLNTAVLLASSVTIEIARRRAAAKLLKSFRRWWAFTTALGLAFLAGQVIAWRQLVHAGFYLKSNPANSFFYMLTAAHGAHLAGGVIALLYVGLRVWERARITRDAAAELASIYWHFMDGLWVFLLILLNLGR
jgi:cytochrome c oxidase subunit 3